jgi:outer membrane protein assembly factor BamB
METLQDLLMTIPKLVSAAACLTMLCGAALAQPWPRFRGPNGEGTSEAATIPVQWTTADYNWRVKLPGVGHSSPVVWDGQIFVTSAEEDDGTQIIRCLRTSDGGLIWKQEFPSSTHEKNEFNAYASATPALDETQVYMVWATPEHYVVVALDRHSGREIWRRDLGPYVAEHGFGSSPIVFGDLVIVSNDQDGPSSVVAMDRETGATRWETPRRTVKAGYATPFIYQPEGRRPELILNSWGHGIFSLDPATGGSNWELEVFQHRVVGSPVLAAGLIWAGAGTGGSGKRYVAVRPGNEEAGVAPELVHEVAGSLPYVPTSVVYGDLIFLWYDRGVVTCLDAPSGEIRWRERVGGDYFGSPVRVDDRLYCISREGEMVVLAASDRFEELARISLEEPSSATPAVADGVMYLRTLGHLMTIGGGPPMALSSRD